MTGFWSWLIWGTLGSRAGLRNIVNKYLVVHCIIAVLCINFIISSPFDFAAKALFPAASILVGMSLAWTTRAATLFQNNKLRDALFKEERSAEDYVYGFQLAILVIIIMVVYVAIMAGGGINYYAFSDNTDQFIAGFFLYLLLSLSVRECWGVINFTNMLSILDYKRP